MDVASLPRAGRFGAGCESCRRGGRAALRLPAVPDAMGIGHDVFPHRPEEAACMDLCPKGFGRALNG